MNDIDQADDATTPNLARTIRAAEREVIHFALTWYRGIGEHDYTGRSDRLNAAIIELGKIAPPVVNCGQATVFWPDDECCEASCHLPKGHQPAGRHEDPILGEWGNE